MLGAIVGDIIGSSREGMKSHFNADELIVALEKNGSKTQLSPAEPILHEGLSFTDDSVLTIATDKALRDIAGEKADFAKFYADFFDIHSEPNEMYHGDGIGYGMMFMEWATARLNGEDLPGYNSYGNGSAMRVSPVAYYFDNMVMMLNVARASSICTHNHPKGIEGAQVVALAVWAARKGMAPAEIRELVEANSDYCLEFDEEKLVRNYVFQATCQGSVPQALWAALEGPDFTSVMKRCLRIGGDTDTIAAIAGAVSEPLYGIPNEMTNTALKILKRDGPFLYDEYQQGILRCDAYNGSEPTPNSPSTSWLSRLVRLFKNKSVVESSQ